MPFQYLTFAAARAVLAARLQDSGLVYWSQPKELDNCIYEALRFHNLLTGSYKQKVTVPVVQDQVYYDLPNIPTCAAIKYNVTDVEVANNVLAALLEPPLVSPPSAWQGSGQFVVGQIQAALENRLNRLIGDTGCVVSQRTLVGPSPPVDLVALPDPVVDVRRLSWTPTPVTRPPANPSNPLGRIDEWSWQAYLPDGPQNPGVPLVYSVYGTNPLTVRLVPAPLATGNLQALLVLAGPQVMIDPANPVLLGVPDDLSMALKWGTLADVLSSDGPSRDHTRSQYCEQRYNECVSLSSLYPSILTSDINNITGSVGSVNDLDFYMPEWEATAGPPQFIGMCGRNMMCLGPTPDVGSYSVGLWVVANAFIGADGDFIQVARDQIDPVLDYAQHIACFKMGGAEFDGTSRLFQNMIEAAKRQNNRLSSIAFYRSQLEQPAVKSEMEVPRASAVSTTTQ